MGTLSVASALDIICPIASYLGSLTANDEKSYNALTWRDEREKPSWSLIQICRDKPCPESTWSGSEWDVDYLCIKSTKKDLLSEDCHSAIVLTPITCSALGSVHTYDCRKIDQHNARSAYTISKEEEGTRGIKCNDGVRFELRQHTSLQSFQVLVSMFDHVEDKRERLTQKSGAVDSINPDDYATPEDAIAAINNITW